jgi:hypothetical protein
MRKRPGALQAWVPGRAYRVAAFCVVAGTCAAALLVSGPSTTLLIAIVLCTPTIALIVPELIEFWPWLAGKAEEHAVDRAERIYRFGYTDIRMLKVGASPWFAAADICAALGLRDEGEETRSLGAALCRAIGDGGERYLSEAGVTLLMERSPHPDARSFRNWFTREVMSPFARAREHIMGDEVRCTQCGKVVTDEAASAFEQIRYAGYNPMSIQYAQDQTKGQRAGFLASYMCKACRPGGR